MIRPFQTAMLSSLLCVLCGCSLGAKEFQTRRQWGPPPNRNVILFFIDGLSPDVLERMLDAGDLPSIDGLFARGGVGVQNAVTSLPAVTYANAVTMLTGRHPGHHGILGNRWFDRRTLEFRDYVRADSYRSVNDHFDAPTIYDALSDQFTLSVQNHTRRGVTLTKDFAIRSGLDVLFGLHSNTDRRVGDSMGWVKNRSRQMGRWPALLCLYFPGVDAVAHEHGPASRQYERAVRVVDQAIGKVIAAVDANSLTQRTYYVLVSDHGHVARNPSRVFNVVRWFKKRFGWRILHKPLSPSLFANLASRMQEYDAVIPQDGSRKLAIHLRGRKGWSDRPTFDALRDIVSSKSDVEVDGFSSLLQIPAVGFVCIRSGENRVQVFRGDRRFEVQRRTEKGTNHYRVIDIDEDEPAGRRNNSNPNTLSRAVPQHRTVPQHHAVSQHAASFASPLSKGGPRGVSQAWPNLPQPHLGKKGGRKRHNLAGRLDETESNESAKPVAWPPPMSGGWHSSRDWLTATASNHFPDFIPQVVEMFDSVRAGDMVIFARDDWMLSPSGKGDHGSNLRADMRIPMYFAGADLPKGRKIQCARLVDLVPTILELIGEEQRIERLGAIDGKSLVEQLFGR